MSGAQSRPQAGAKGGQSSAARTGAPEQDRSPAQPQPQPQPQPKSMPKSQPQPQAQPKPEQRSGDGQSPHHPPQAYPAPPSEAPDGGVRKPRTGARTVPRVRKARLRVAKTDPWSVMKVSFLLSLALGLCTIVAAAVLWMVMDAMGVFATLGGTINDATGSEVGAGFDLESFLSLPRVLLFTTVIALIDVVLATALATLGAFIYNLSAGFVGGVELTLAEDE